MGQFWIFVSNGSKTSSFAVSICCTQSNYSCSTVKALLIDQVIRCREMQTERCS